MAKHFLGVPGKVPMIKATTTMTARVTAIITTTTKTLSELDSKMQDFAAMNDCSCLLKIYKGTTYP